MACATYGLYYLALCLGGCLGLASFAHAWGEAGHRLVADIAEAQLEPTLRDRLRAMLATQGHETLADISIWADEHRNPTTAAWHFVNFPWGSCHYRPERDCADGNCVVAAIERQMLAYEQARDDKTRLLALKYLVHFVADVHQPLHAGFADDRGGNGYQLRFFGQGSNLHTMWDRLIIQQLASSAGWRTGMIGRRGAAHLDTGLLGSVQQPATQDWNAGTSVLAAQESCNIVSRDGFYPARNVDADYLERFTPVLEQRLQTAGLRLAALLRQLLTRP